MSIWKEFGHYGKSSHDDDYTGNDKGPVRVQQCETCEGTGWPQGLRYYAGNDEFLCQVCKGSGEVEIASIPVAEEDFEAAFGPPIGELISKAQQQRAQIRKHMRVARWPLLTWKRLRDAWWNRQTLEHR